MSSGPNLRAVATLSEDTQHINTEECARRNIRVLCCPPSDLDGQADLTVALILLTLRSVVEGAQACMFKNVTRLLGNHRPG